MLILDALPLVAFWLDEISQQDQPPIFQIPPSKRDKGPHESYTSWQGNYDQAHNKPDSSPGSEDGTSTPKIKGETSKEGQEKSLSKR